MFSCGGMKVSLNRVSEPVDISCSEEERTGAGGWDNRVSEQGTSAYVEEYL